MPHVPAPQWVLSFPHPLRFLFAFNHELCRQALTIFTRALMSLQRRRARQAGIQDGHSGTVTVIQRFASGLRLNLHLHTLMLDGVFYETQSGELRFYSLYTPDPRAKAPQWWFARWMSGADHGATNGSSSTPAMAQPMLRTGLISCPFNAAVG